MRRTHTGKIIALLMLMFLTSYGETYETLLRMGYNAPHSYSLVVTFANILLISVVMMAVPFVLRIINKEKLPHKSGKLLCGLNSILLFIVSLVLKAVTNVSFINGWGAVCYYFFNKWLFVEESQQYDSSLYIASKDTSTRQQLSSVKPITPNLSSIECVDACSRQNSVDPIVSNSHQHASFWNIIVVVMLIVSVVLNVFLMLRAQPEKTVRGGMVYYLEDTFLCEGLIINGELYTLNASNELVKNSRVLYKKGSQGTTYIYFQIFDKYLSYDSSEHYILEDGQQARTHLYFDEYGKSYIMSWDSSVESWVLSEGNG